MDECARNYRPSLLLSALIGLSRHTFFGRGAMRKLMARSVRALNPDHPLDVSLYGGQARHTG